MKKKMRNHISAGRRLIAFALAAGMVLQLAACGKEEEEDKPQTQTKEWVWVPEYVGEEGESSHYNKKLVGDAICYINNEWDEETNVQTTTVNKYSLTNGTTDTIPLVWEGENQGLNRLAVGPDGTIWGVANVWPEEAGPDGMMEPAYYLCRFDPKGKQTLFQNISELLEDGSGDRYINEIAVDGQGRLYIATDGGVMLFEEDGNYMGLVAMDGTSSWIQSMGMDKGGKMYICYYSNTGSSGGYVLTEVDFDNRKMGETYSDFPATGSFGPGREKDILTYDDGKVYEYDLVTKTLEELFDWMDSDINGSYVENVGYLEDGRIVASISDWESNENSIAVLTKTDAEQVVQKETIVIATLSSAYDIRSSAVKFNKSSDKYRITVREYFDYDYNNYTEDSYKTAMSDALNRLLNDLTSDNCPDIIDLVGMDIQDLVDKGLIEDLGIYLDKSSKISRSDILENVLDIYTYNGILTCIPTSVSLQTVVGKTADVGEEMGWTLEEVMAYGDAHPDARLFDHTSKSTIMSYMIMLNGDAFIDWSTGECRFDSEEFKKLLEFVNRFPDEDDYNSDTLSTPNKIQKGDVLLDMVYISQFNDIQIYGDIYQGDYTLIGFPTVDGEGGCVLSSSSTYAVTSKSARKDGAWEFLEGMLAQEPSRHFWGFPTVKKYLNAMMEEEMRKYYMDEEGNPVLDENGQPMVREGTSSISYEDGWSYTYHVVTQEEVDMVMELLNTAEPVAWSGSEEVGKIISEEAEAFYKGQKTVDEVAKIIQSRIKMYVETNS